MKGKLHHVGVTIAKPDDYLAKISPFHLYPQNGLEA